MNRKERLMKTLNFEEPDRPPHFEQLFELTEEAFGLVMPKNDEINKAKGHDQLALFERCAFIYAKIIEKYEWDTLTVSPPAMGALVDQPDHPAYKFIPYLKNYLRKYFHEDIPVGTFLWNAFICIDRIKDYMQFSIQLADDRQSVIDWAQQIYDEGFIHTKRLLDCGADFIDIASDHAFNSGTFLSPTDFAELVTPYKKKMVKYIQSRGAWVIMHSDGNLMGVLDQIIDIGPDVLQSIDPQAGMDIAEVKKLTYGKIALMGNVQCSYLQSGPKEKIIESCKYCLDKGSPGGGFIFSSSNTIFPGVPLENYQLMMDYFHSRF